MKTYLPHEARKKQSLFENSREIHSWIILVFPLVLLTINDNWCYSPIGWIDPWLYLGYKLSYPSFVSDLFPSTYYASRMTPLIIGHATFLLLPDALANHVNHMFWYYMGTFSIYYIVKYFTNRSLALIASLCLGCHGWFAVAIGWDYPDGAGIACQLLCIAFLTRALPHQKPRWQLAAAGAAAAAMIHAHLFQFFFCPTFAIYYFALSAEIPGQSVKRRIFEFFFWFGIGAVATTGVYGAINLVYGGSFLFFMPSIQFGSSFSKEINPWAKPIEVWLPKGTHLFMPLIAVALSTATLLRGLLKRDVDKILIVFSVNMVVVFTAMLFWHLKGQPVFQLTYYTSFMLPHVALVLSIIMARNREATEVLAQCWRPTLGLITFTVLLLVSSLLWWLNDTYQGLVVWLLPKGLSVFALWCLAGIALLLGFLRVVFLNNAWSKPLGTFGCVFAAGISGSHFSLSDIAAKDTFKSVVQVHRWVADQSQDRYPLFWYNKNAPLKREYCAFASTYLWGYSLVNDDLPNLSRKRAEGILESHRIFITTQDDRELVVAQETLRTCGFTCRVHKKIEFPYAGTIFKIVAIDVFPVQGSKIKPAVVRYDSNKQTFYCHGNGNGEAIPELYGKWTVFPSAQETCLYLHNETWGIKTKALTGSCAARLGPFYADFNGTLRFVLCYDEFEGRIIWGVLDQEGQAWRVKAASETKCRSFKFQEVTFDVQKDIPFWLGIGNMRKQEKGATDILLKNIEVFSLTQSLEHNN